MVLFTRLYWLLHVDVLFIITEMVNSKALGRLTFGGRFPLRNANLNPWMICLLNKQRVILDVVRM